MSKKIKKDFSKSYLENILKEVQKAERELGIPRWYRGLSKSQVAAESGLTNSLRDDLEQGTCHRLKQSLKDMGLQPVIKEKQLRVAMKISRGNDLAFIYFLLQNFYKTPESARTTDNGFINFNPNEQILMTCIYHLDALLTLRELDKILPPGHADIHVLEENEKLAKKNEKLKKRAISRKFDKSIINPKIQCSALPYFQRQPKPKLYGKPLHCPRPKYKINFHFEEKLDRLKYTIPNEANRWFADFQIQPTKRAAKAVVDECIGKIFEKHTHDLDCPETYKCEHYKVVSEVQNILQCRFNLIVKDKCLNLMSYKDEEHQKRLEMLVTNLVEDITEFLRMYAAIRRKPEEYIIQLNNPNGTEVYFLTLSEFKLYVETFRNLYLNKRTVMCTTETNELLETIKEFPAVLKIKRDGNCAVQLDVESSSEEMIAPAPTLKICECECDKVIEEVKSETKVIERKFSVGNGRGDFTEQDRVFPFEIQLLNDCVKSEEKFFTAPTNNKPFCFNFAKILKYDPAESENLKIKNIFLDALNENALYKYKFDNTLSCTPNLAEAVDYIATETFKQQSTEAGRLTEILHPISPLFQRKRFDCNDNKLMNTMLEQAFAYLRKDPKFVLVTFPDAHKLPIFGFYIKRRYGKTYTTKERLKLMHNSMNMFEGIIRLFFHKYNMKLRGVPGITIGYNHKKCLLQKFQPIVKKYHERLEFLILEQARLFWLAARPSLGVYERTRLPFYCYTPAKRTDVKFFRVWKPDEYRDMTFASKRRMLETKRAF